KLDAERVKIYQPSHSIPIIVGDSAKAIRLSSLLADEGLKVLPIRTPTVPPHTERLRISFSSSLDVEEAELLAVTLNKLL
ncbi:MAG: hypothetical protein K2K52_06520, partial [Paramuribaculum sp.]|nr:hypothetical protein [Paramuribaculum sp.]